MEIDLTSFIDNKQNVWFKVKDFALILGYSNTRDAIKRHVSGNHKIERLSRQRRETRRWSETYFIDEAGFYELVFGSKLETAKKFRDWVFTQVLTPIPIRKYGQYKLFDYPNNHMFKIENEFDLHTKVVKLLGNFTLSAFLWQRWVKTKVHHVKELTVGNRVIPKALQTCCL